MSVSLAYLQRCAGDTGFQVGALEKVVRLGEFAADVARHPFLGAILALKGGTALNLCFGSPARLSVDLDFNYIGRADREGMLEDRPRVEAAVKELGAGMATAFRNLRTPSLAGRSSCRMHRCSARETGSKWISTSSSGCL